MNKIHFEKYIGLGCALLFASLTDAAGLSISNTPLYVTQPLAPNIIVSPVYAVEYNEVSLRNAPWDKFDGICNGSDTEQPCAGLYSQDIWDTGAPFYKFETSNLAGRVTPWPNVVKVGDSQVNSSVSFYPHDSIVVGGVTQFKPVDYISAGTSSSFVTEEQYPESAVLNPKAAGKARYSRSNLNFLYFSKTVADGDGNGDDVLGDGYSPWPNMGGYNFTAYANAAAASTPYYHPINKKGYGQSAGPDLTAVLDSPVTGYYSRHCHATANDRECYRDALNSTSVFGKSISLVTPLIGQYWTYNTANSPPVWRSASYTQKTWSAMEPAEKINFAHWFTYWRTSDLATRGMLGRLVDTLSSNKKDLLHKIRLGIFHADMAGNKRVKVEFEDTESLLLGKYSTIIYNQDNVYTVARNDDIGDRRYGTSTIWDPSETVRYFQTEVPYREDPRDTNSIVRSCRRNYEIVLTPDYTGIRRDYAPSYIAPRTVSAAPADDNYDANLGVPYSDAYANTLGDVGAYGWHKDLMPGLPDSLLRTNNNDMESQHLVRYVIGPSDNGIVFNQPMSSYGAALAHLTEHPASGWDDPSPTVLFGPSAIDELWHMALNSRGFFYQGDNISDALDKLLASINDILTNNVSGSSIATSTTSLSAGGTIYRATVESDWKGHLRAYGVSLSNTILEIDYGTPLWDLAAEVSSQADGAGWDTGREIATYNGGGVPFQWANIGDTAKGLLKTALPTGVTGVANADAYGEKLLEYLRGSGYCEDGSGFNCVSGGSYVFRRRNLERNNTAPYALTNVGGRNVLGDIANSNPWLVAPPRGGRLDVDFPDYNAFRVANKTRTKVLYVGANDGMLHAVDARDCDEPCDKGKELFAYIPSFVQANLHEFSRASYAHTYFVDGSPFAADVDLSGWKTVLAGGANKGGKGYYLLDVTSPTTNTEANAATWVKWEFTHPRDLHYTFNLPVADSRGQARQIARMNDGNLALIVGNGYPEEAGKMACLFILRLSGPGAVPDGDTVGADYHGTGYHKLCAGVPDYSATGTNDGGLGTNGLSTPTPIDLTGDGKVDVIYAGDLNGNMWRFDVASATPANWAVAYSGAPLFVAKNAAAKRQPIITSPEVTLLSEETTSGPLVLFGTGKYIEGDDRANTDVQSFYGVWDRGLSGITRGNLFAQTFQLDTTNVQQHIRKQSSKLTPTYCTAATLSDCPNVIPALTDPPTPIPVTNRHLGWFWDMPTSGERLTGKMSLINGIVVFNTFYPATESYDCDGAGSGTALCTRLDPCQYGGDGWIMGLNAVNGYMEDQFSVFDVNLDGVINSGDVRSAGVKIGAVMGGTTLAKGTGNTYVGLGEATNDDPPTRRVRPPVVNVNTPGSGRVSWFELLD